MKFGSLFSGIGGFDLGLERAGMTCAWQSEIDPACIALLNQRFTAPLIPDCRNVTANTAEPVDLICGGFPCQDVSVAGKRAGLAGERSGLWFEFDRILSELKPAWVLIENVPGLLSSNAGKDIQMIIDSLTQIGYTVDIDIKDAQEFGVPQRRRRVFLTCVRLDVLLRRKTPFSKQISADLLAQTLLNTWGAIQPALSLVPLHSVYGKPIERCEVLLSKMMNLFKITLERLACKPSQSIWDVLLDQFGDAGRNSEYGLIASAELPAPQLPGKAMCESLLRRISVENGALSISTLLSSALADGYRLANKSITSTWTQETTDQTIFTFAVACLNIIARIIPSLNWSVSCWSAAQSALMLLQENINYARQASSQLFIGPGLRDGWWDYLCAASHIESELERRIRGIRAAQVLFESESVSGNSAARRTAQPAIAGTLAAGAHPGGFNGRDADRGMLVANTLGAHHGRNDMDSMGAYIFEPRFARNGRGGPEPISPLLKAQSGRTGKGDSAPVVACNWQSGGDVRHSFGLPSLQANQVPAVGVRRLTPLECERLQGFPDGWTENGQSDSARYRQLGNAVAVPVVEWIGRRIVNAEEQP